MGNHKSRSKYEGSSIHRGVGVYFRGRMSNDDDRQLIYGAVINNKLDSFGRKVMYLGCSIDGETIVDYYAERNDCATILNNEQYRSLSDIFRLI